MQQPTPKKQSKAAFVRSQPADLPAKEVMRRAKLAGLSLSEAYVYVIRSKTAAARKARGRAGSGGSRQQQQQERQLLTAALELGMHRTEEVLSRFKAEVAQLAS